MANGHVWAPKANAPTPRNRRTRRNTPSYIDLIWPNTMLATSAQQPLLHICLSHSHYTTQLNRCKHERYSIRNVNTTTTPTTTTTKAQAEAPVSGQFTPNAIIVVRYNGYLVPSLLEHVDE
jgi:hydroxyacyl-ACP dehydratase HTD2-like protein with hotdog domain